MNKSLLAKCYEQHLQNDYLAFEQMMDDYNDMIKQKGLKHIVFKSKGDKNGK